MHVKKAVLMQTKGGLYLAFVCICLCQITIVFIFFFCETWFRTLKKEHKLDYKCPKLKIPVPKRKEVQRKCIGSVRSNEEFSDVYCTCHSVV
jgi:hypothetical protein